MQNWDLGVLNWVGEALFQRLPTSLISLGGFPVGGMLAHTSDIFLDSPNDATSHRSAPCSLQQKCEETAFSKFTTGFIQTHLLG